MKSYVAAFVKGMQANGGAPEDTYQVIVTCKHYAGYDLENWGNGTRYSFDAQINMQDLTEYYLPPFEQCARSKVASFMCSYNSVNGVPACADSYLMGDILREHWGWTDENQYVTSDCDAFYQAIYQGHKYASDFDDATGLAFTAGVDTACFYPPLNASPPLRRGCLPRRQWTRCLCAPSRLSSSLVTSMGQALPTATSAPRT